MKKILETPFKVLLLVVIILLFINAILLLSGGIWNIQGAGEGVACKIHKITGKTYFIRGQTMSPIHTYLPPTMDREKADALANEIRQEKIKKAVQQLKD